MPEYLIYGKRTERIHDKYTGETIPPDKTFRALDAKGIRVNKLENAMSFATKQDAQEFLDSHGHKPGTIFEIRKAK